MSEPILSADNGPILIQIRDSEWEWTDYGRCDAEKAGRFLGWGDNANWYRAVNPITRYPMTVEIVAGSREPVRAVREWRIVAHADGTGILEIRIGNMSEEELSALIAVLSAFRYTAGS